MRSKSGNVQSVRLRDIPRAGWVVARAFSKPSAPLAALVHPSALIVAFQGFIFRNGYLTPSRNGYFEMGKLRPHGYVLAITVAWLVAPLFVLVAVAVLAIPAIPRDLILVILNALNVATSVMCLVLLWAMSGSLVSMRRSGPKSGKPVGPETPKGPYYLIQNFAEHPASRSTAALHLARSEKQITPAGSLLVAVAANDDLYMSYLKAGFTAGADRRVYRRV
jgi:hypothetical protein